MSFKTVLAASLAAAAFAGLAAAQDYSADPLFGEVSLDPGFMPDPYTVDLIAGGGIDASAIDASSFSDECVGMIANAPDYRLYYGAGGSQMYVGVESDADTTLVVNAPDGTWYCNDDFHGLDPVVGGGNPLAGQYDIWVGTFGTTPAEATLYITEYTQ
jgi:hypothetical protein